MKKFLFTAVVLLSFTFSGGSQTRQFDNPYDTHAEHMYENARAKYDVSTVKSMGFERWQAEFRKELKDKLGISLLENQIGGFKPEAEMTLREDVGYATREWWKIRTEPDVTIPFIVLIPKNLNGKAPLMLTPHGHSKSTISSTGIYMNESEREKGEEGERNVALQAVQHGFIAIAPTARGFGDTRLPIDIEQGNTSSCLDLYLKDALVGRTPVGDRVWDIMKLIDWALETLPVDGRNIIISGNSGGGTVSLYAGAVDTRISMALPSSSFSDFSMSIGHRRHCACNYVPGIMQLGGMGEISGLIAPRPCCIIQGKDDEIFPIAGSEKSFEVTKEIYSIAGAPDACSLYIGDGGHRYYKQGAWEFIGRHLNEVPAPETVPAWKKGMLDIHFISTGCGNSSFFVMPDGTTMLVDAGDIKRPDVRVSKIRPNESKSAGEWIEDYIRWAAPGIRGIDYAVVTHYHDDHIGCSENARRKHPQGEFPLSGITEVGSDLPFGTLIDRGYEYPSDPGASIAFYRQFVDWSSRNAGMKHEIAAPGSENQIRLLKDPEAFRNFKIRMLFSAGNVAGKSGEGIEKRAFKAGDKPSENELSTGFRIDYGAFSFYTGGDIAGISHTGGVLDTSMESLVADIVGKVDVAVLNHHGNRDTQNEVFCAALSPRVWIGQSWGTRHPGEETIRRISSKYVYPGDRDIYTNYISSAAKEFLANYINNYTSMSGHILLRVAEGGESYEIYVLDDNSTSKNVLLHKSYK